MSIAKYTGVYACIGKIVVCSFSGERRAFSTHSLSPQPISLVCSLSPIQWNKHTNKLNPTTIAQQKILACDVCVYVYVCVLLDWFAGWYLCVCTIAQYLL